MLSTFGLEHNMTFHHALFLQYTTVPGDLFSHSSLTPTIDHMLQGILATSVVLAMELFPTEERTFAGTAVEFFWALGYMVLCPIAYGLRNWRHLQLAISVPLVLTISFYW